MTTVQTEKEFDELDCPGCGDHIKIPRKKASHTIGVNEHVDIESAVERAIERKLPKPAVEEKPKEVEVPSYLPKHFCKGKGCDGHDNAHRKKITKKCINCDPEQVLPENAGKCPWCGDKDFEDLDDDALERFNKGMEHDHEHE